MMHTELYARKLFNFINQHHPNIFKLKKFQRVMTNELPMPMNFVDRSILFYIFNNHFNQTEDLYLLYL